MNKQDTSEAIGSAIFNHLTSMLGGSPEQEFYDFLSKHPDVVSRFTSNDILIEKDGIKTSLRAISQNGSVVVDCGVTRYRNFFAIVKLATTKEFDANRFIPALQICLVPMSNSVTAIFSIDDCTDWFAVSFGGNRISYTCRLVGRLIGLRGWFENAEYDIEIGEAVDAFCEYDVELA